MSEIEELKADIRRLEKIVATLVKGITKDIRNDVCGVSVGGAAAVHHVHDEMANWVHKFM